MPRGGQYIAEMLARLQPPLTDLNLADSRLGGPGARFLRDAMARSPLRQLRRLDLFACHVGPRGAEAVAAMLGAGDMPVSELYLADNAIAQSLPAPPDCSPSWRVSRVPVLRASHQSGRCACDPRREDQGRAAFSAALRGCAAFASRIEVLDLSSNGLGLAGGVWSPEDQRTEKEACVEFGGALALASQLRELNLSENFLDDGGVVPIVEALAGGAGKGRRVWLRPAHSRTMPPPPRAVRRLELLELSACYLRAPSALALTAFMEAGAGAALHSLGLYRNLRVGDGAMAGLLRALHEHVPRLRTLKIGQTGLGGADGGALDACVPLVAPGRLETLDLRGNDPAESERLAAVLAAARARDGLKLQLPEDAWDEASTLDGYHPSGLIARRQMWARMYETVIFIEGDDAGGERNQAPV
eukprot:4324542-Prymnesium_polylepis.1